MNVIGKRNLADVYSFFFLPAILCMGVLFVLMATSASAQSTAAGTVAGQVTDQQGAAIVGAEVRLNDLTTNIARNTVTNEAGRYNFINVSPGTYDLTVTKPGFAAAKISDQKVEVGLALTLN